MVTHWIRWIDSSLILEHSSLGWRTRILNSNWPLTCSCDSRWWLVLSILGCERSASWLSQVFYLLIKIVEQRISWSKWKEGPQICLSTRNSVNLFTLVIRYNEDNNIVCRCRTCWEMRGPVLVPSDPGWPLEAQWMLAGTIHETPDNIYFLLRDPSASLRLRGLRQTRDGARV